MSTTRRILKETQRLQSDSIDGIKAKPHSDNMRYFDVEIKGPDSSPYAGGIFKLELFLPEDYPIKPPSVRFLTKIYHPNIDKVGRICLDVLKERWTPALTIAKTLLCIQSLLNDPNLDDPLANNVADHFKTNYNDAYSKAKMWTQEYSSKKSSIIY